MVVIGNGPSLNRSVELYGQQIQEFDSIMVNFAAVTEMYELLKPSVYMLADPAWFKPSKDIEQSINNCIDAILNKTTWSIYIVMSRDGEDSIVAKRLKENPNINILFFDDCCELPKGMSQYEAWDKNVIAPSGYSVLNFALWASIYWGYKEIYLIGADSSWLEDTHVDQDDNRVYTIDTHFYNNDKVYKNPKLWKENRRYISYKYHEEVETIYIILKSYWELRGYADWKHVKIYNASEYSCIDAFERKKLK